MLATLQRTQNSDKTTLQWQLIFRMPITLGGFATGSLPNKDRPLSRVTVRLKDWVYSPCLFGGWTIAMKTMPAMSPAIWPTFFCSWLFDGSVQIPQTLSDPTLQDLTAEQLNYPKHFFPQQPFLPETILFNSDLRPASVLEGTSRARLPMPPTCPALHFGEKTLQTYSRNQGAGKKVCSFRICQLLLIGKLNGLKDPSLSWEKWGMTPLDTVCLGEAVMCSSNWCTFTGRLRRRVLGFLAKPEKSPEPVMLVASPSAEKAPEPVMPVPSPSAEKAEPVASPSSSHSGSHMLSDENAAQKWKCLEKIAILETAATCRHVIYV